MAYAENTQVSADRSKSELKRVIYKNGGANYQYAESDDKAMIMFSKENRVVQFKIDFPAPTDNQFTRTPTGKSRSKDSAFTEYEKECRRRWRALILSVKAKFESVESNIETFETAFLAQILLPSKKTVAEMALPEIEDAYKNGSPRVKLLS